MHNIRTIIIGLVVILLSIPLHEFGHAFAADRLGDPTPRSQGRVTLWPDKHFDVFGLIMIVITTIWGFGIGWGKPVEFNPRNLANPRRDTIIISLAGPAMNLLIALVFGLSLRFAMRSPDFYMMESLPGLFAFYFVIINLSLMFFNLIPIPPLDGSKVLSGLLPQDLAYSYDRVMNQWGPMILLLLIFVGRGLIGSIISPAVYNSMKFITGIGA